MTRHTFRILGIEGSVKYCKSLRLAPNYQLNSQLYVNTLECIFTPRQRGNQSEFQWEQHLLFNSVKIDSFILYVFSLFCLNCTKFYLFVFLSCALICKQAQEFFKILLLVPDLQLHQVSLLIYSIAKVAFNPPPLTRCYKPHPNVQSDLKPIVAL